MSDFDRYIKLYEMGQSYVAITDQFGPSKQLLLFVNYDETKIDGTLGLEALDVDTTHAQILEQIYASNSLELACESFTGRIASITEKVKNALTFNRHDNLTDLASGSLEERKSNIYVTNAGHFERAETYVKEALATLDFILPKIPKNHSMEEWCKFYTDHVASKESSDLGSHIRSTGRNYNLFKELGKQGEFSKAGWSAERFQKGCHTLGTIQTDFSHHTAKVNDTCRNLRETLALVESSKNTHDRDSRERDHDVIDSIDNHYKKDDDPTKKKGLDDVVDKMGKEIGRQQRAQQHNMLMKMVPADAVKAMNQVAICVDDAVSLISHIERWMYKSLVNVSRHYEVVHHKD
jgi:hypothetical protein